MISINSNQFKQIAANSTSQSHKGLKVESQASLTKPLAQMERIRKQDPNIALNGKKYQKLMHILDSKATGQGGRKSQQMRQSYSKTSNGQPYRPVSSIQ